MPVLLANKNLREEFEAAIRQYRNDDPIVVSRLTLRAALGRFVEKKLSAEDLASWASSLEARDEIKYESGFERLVADVLFKISSPEINGPLDPGSCLELMAQLT